MISSVAASDTNSTDNQAVSTADTVTLDDVSDSENNEVLKSINNDSAEETLSVESNNDKLGVSYIDVTTYSQLSSAVSSGDKIINIKNDIKFSSMLTIGGNNIVIDGNGYTIDCQNTCKAFKILSKNDVTLLNINFINGYSTANDLPSEFTPATGGGCVIIANCKNVEVSNCNFKNMVCTSSSANKLGSAMVIAAGSNINLNYCVFDNCYTSQSGGALEFIRMTQDGVTKYSDNVNADHLTFKNCYTTGGNGGAIEIYVTNSKWSFCTFTNNHVTSSGGAIGVWDGENNMFINCTFTDNDAGSNGGAICTQTSAVNTQIINCTFTNNKAKNGAAVYFVAGSSSITNCKFTGNNATTNGGAVLFDGESCSMSNSDFISNSATSGGAFYFNGANSNVYNCAVIGNKGTNGGGVYFNAQNGILHTCNFENNTATATGGAVYATATGSTVNTCTFKNCTANTCNYFYQGQPITFINTYFPEVYVGNDNAGGDSLDPNSLGKFSTAMTLVETGGTMYIVGSLTNFQNHEVTRGITIKPYTTSSNINLASVSGRAFTISASDVTIRDLTFSGSKYNGNGGVLYWAADNGNIYNCTFYNNKLSSSSGKGGAIYVGSGSDILIIEKCGFNSNQAYDGGSIYVDSVTDNTLIYNSEFTYSTATHYGGALYYAGEICYYVDENTINSFNHNSANAESTYNNIYDKDATKCILVVYVSKNGGGDGASFGSPTTFDKGFSLVAPNGKVYFVNANEEYTVNKEYKTSKFNISFYGNDSTLNGFNLTINPSAYSIKFSNLIFTGNSVSTIIWNGINGVVENCTFKDNGGNNGLKGVAIQINGENLLVKNTIFTNNQALSSNANGGAIWCNATNLNIIGCNFSSNKASLGGLHVYLAEGANYTEIFGSRFSNGVRTGTGSAIIKTNGTIMVYKSTFESNKGEYGGALRLLNGSATVDGSSFTSNEATYGGAIYANCTLTLTNSNFTLNQATEHGGALYISNPSVNLENIKFERNIAKTGSAIYFNNTKEITFKNLTFAKNTASVDATVYFTTSANVYNDEFVSFTGNTLPTDNSLNIVTANNGKINATVFYVANEATGTGLTWGKDATTLDYALEHVFENGKIFFSPGEYDLDKITITQNIALVGNQTTLKRKSTDKYLFILQNGVVLNISDITLTAGIEAVSGSELNLDNVIFTGTSANDGGIIYDTGSSGSIVNSNFTGVTSLYDGHIVTVNGNVDINNTKFSSNSITGSALYYGSAGTGSISNSVFTDNQASSDVRNIHIEDISKVTLSSNTFDVNVTYTITNSTYGSLAYIQGTFDAGVNFNINNIKLIINDTGKTNTTVNINPTTNAFSFDVSGKLAVGKYNLTVSNNDGNKYNVNYLSNNFEVTKASITINQISGITVSYGDNDTITVIGSITNNIGYGKNYTGDVSVIIADNDAVNATVSENGIFTVNVNVKAFNKGVYALNITVRGNDNYNGASNKFNSYLTVQDATIAITGIENITVDYGVDYVIVNGTLNSTRFGANYTGNITVTVAGLSNKTQALDGKFSVRITNSTPFRAGKYDITASGEAISNYNAIASYTLTEGLVVNGIVPEFIISAPSIGYGENATIYIILPDDATGKVVIEVENGGIKTIENIYGKNNITFGILPSGSYKVNATYYGDNNYRQVEANSTLFVERPRTSLNISVEDTFVGNNVLINFTINSAVTGELFNNAGGSLRVYVGGDVYQVNVTNGKGSLSIPDLSIAGYNVIAIYSGDDNYAGCDGYGKFNVKGRETGLNITLSKDEALVGSNIIVTVKVNEEINDDPVYLYIDGKLYNILLTSDGTAVFNVTNLKYGVHNFTAVFTATSVFGAATNSTLVSIIKNNPNFSPEAVSDKDLHVFVKFTLPDDATGEVNITYGGTVIKTVAVTGGSQTVQLDGTYSANNYTFTMTYGGDDKYYNATASDTVEVGKISDYEMNITSSIILRDQDVTIYVNLPNEFGNNGTVNLTVNGTSYNLPLINGGVSQTVHTTGLDTIEVVAIYSGYDNYDSKTVSKVFTVGQISEYDINITVDTAYVGDDVIVNINAPVQFDNVNFTITVNGIKANVSIVNGRGNYTVNNVSLGYYEVSVTSVENKYFVAKTATGGFDVIKRTSVLNITDIPGVIYVNGEFNITVENNLKGDAKIILYVDGVKKAEKSWSDNIFTIEGLSSGNHIITVSFEGNDYYYSNSNSTTVNVLKLDSTVSAHADNIEVGENLIVNVTASGNGSATIYIYDQSGAYIGEYILSVKNGEGQIIVPYKFTEKGQYTINITYNGDDIYNVSKNTASFLVDLATDYVFKVITTDAYVGSDVIVNVTLPVNANQDVTLTLPNGTNITKAAVNGIASFNIPDMAAGDYIVNATYAGDNNYARATKFGKFSVYKHDPVIDLSFNTTESGVDVINSIVEGEKTTLIIQLPDDCNGYVNVTVSDSLHFNNQVLTDGKVTIALDDLSYGDYNIKVDYNGDDKYNNASGSIVLIVASSKPTVEILPISTQVVGSNVNVSVKTNVDKGNVTLYVNGVKLETVNVVNGWANFTINNISGEAATVNVFAVYEANSQYAGAFNSTTFNVTKYTTTIDAVSNVNNITVKLLPGTTGSVIVTFNGINFTSQVNASGIGFISLPKVPGTYNLPVYYSGDSRYYSNSTMVEVNIPWGDDYTLNATVNSTGYVTINIDSRANNVTINWDGSAPVTVDLTQDGDIKVGHYQLSDDLSVGTHIIVVSYAGDDNLGPKSYSLIYNVAKVNDYLFNITAESITVGSPAVIVVNLPDDATGFVVFTVNGEGYSINLANTHNLTLTGLGNGTYNVVAKYLGNDNYDVGENTTSFSVDKLTVVLELNQTVVEIGESLCVLVKFNDNLINTQGEIEVDGDKFSVINGMAVIPASKLPTVAGVYAIDVKYLGDDVYSETGIISLGYEIIKVSDVTITVPGNVTIDQVLNITVAGADDGKLNVTVDDGAVFTVDVINGIASIPADKLPQSSGSHNINLTYWNGSLFADKQLNTTFSSDKITGYTFTITDDSVKFGENAAVEITLPEDVNTTLSIFVNGVEKSVAIINGSGKLENINNLHIGENTVTASFGSDKYETTSADALIIVGLNDITLNITVPTEQLYVDGSAPITVQANVSINASITVYINGKGEVKQLTNGRAEFTIDNLVYGEYTLVANFRGNENYTAATSGEETFSVDKHNATFNVTADSVDVGHKVTVKVNITSGATGLVFVTVDGKKYTLNITNNEFDFEITGLGNGTYSVVAEYLGDNKYNSNRNTTEFTVSKLTPVISVETSPIELSDKLVIIVKYDGAFVANATGNLDFTVEGCATVSVDVVNGIAIISSDKLPNVNGTYAAGVKYYGDDNYAEVTSDISFTINKVSDVIITVPTNVTIDEVLNITVAGADDGKLNVTIDNGAVFTVDVENGIASIPVDKLPQNSGSHNINVTYWGGSVFGDKELSTVFYSDKIADYSFTISNSTIKFGENATVEINLPNDVNVQLTVKINGADKTADIVNGYAKLENVSGLHAGVNTVTATFGSDKYETSTATAAVQVDPNDITLEIILPAEQLYVSQSAAVTVRANVSMNNNVTVYVNGVARSLKLTNGEGSFTINPLAYGKYVFTAIFDGNENYTYASASEKSFSVDKNNVILNITTNNVIVGHNVNIKVNINSDATGLVIVKVNNVDYSLNITNHEFDVSAANLANGTYTIIAKYYGDDKYYGYENTTSVEVLKLTPSITADETILVGEDLVIIIQNTTSIVGNATGKLKLNIDGLPTIEADVINGKTVIKASDLPQVNNTYAADVEYLGDNNYYSLTKEIHFTVNKVSDVVITVPSNVTIDDELIITVGDNTTDGKLNITIGTDAMFTVDVVNGIATIEVTKLPQGSGNYNIQASYWNGSYWGDKEITTNFHADKITDYIFTISEDTVKFGQNATMVIILPNDVTTTLTVKINDADKTVDIVDGYGKLENISGLHAGANTVEATFGNDKYETATATSTIQVDPNDITLEIILPAEQLYVDQSATVTVRANVTMNNNVTLYINGKAESVKLNNGEGSFTINPLVYGKYVFTAMFNGNENYTYTVAGEKSFSVDKNNVTMNVTTNNVIVGHDVNIKVNINSDATGLVIVKINNNQYSLNVTDKEYTLAVPDLGNGTYTIVAKYYGDDKYYGFENTTSVEVLKLTPTISANSSILVGEDLIIVVENAASLVGKATGKLDLIIDGFGTVEANVIDGVAVIKASDLPQANNTYSATVNYYGDNNYYGKVEGISFAVGKVSDVVITVPGNVTIDDELIITVGDSTTDGKLNVTIGTGDVFTVNVINGTAVIPVDKLPQVSDNYNIKLNYYDGSYWDDKEVTTSFHADKITVYDFIISEDTVKFEENATLTITLPSDVNTLLTVKVNGVDKTVEIINGNGKLENINNLHAGVNTVESTFGSDKYETSTATSTIMVNPNDITLTITVPAEQLYVDQSAIITVRANVTMNNNVTVYVNGVARSLELNKGEGSFTIDPLAYGKYVFTAIFDGNENYTYASASEKSFSVDKNNVTLNITTDNVIVGHDVNIKVNVNSDATGLVIVKVNNVEYSLNITAMEYDVTVPNLGNGTYTITTDYYGDNKYYGFKNSTEVTVFKMTPSITANETLLIGEDLEIVIENATSIVANPTGKVILTIEGYGPIEVDVVNGHAVVNAYSMPQIDKTYKAVVDYSGDNNYYGLKQNIVFTINKVPSLVIRVPENVTIDEEMVIRVLGARDGNLNVTVGDGELFTVEVVNGTATVPVKYLPQVSGNYKISLSYYGGSYWNNTDFNTTFHADKVIKYNFKITDDTVKFGENATLLISLPIDVNTILNIKINDEIKSVEIINGAGILRNINNLHAGSNNVTSTFGNDKYETATATSTIQVNPNDITLTITVPTEQLYVDGSATVTVEANVTMNNNITLYINGKAETLQLTNGKATYTIPKLVADDYVFTAIFAGNENYTYTTAAEKSFTVDKINVTLNVTTSDAVVGHPVTINVNINSDATGLVIIKVDNNQYSLNLDNKEYTLTLPSLGNGTHSIAAKYYGDNKYYGYENYTSINITKLTPEITISDSILIGEDFVINMRNTSSLVGLPNGKLVFAVDGYGEVTIDINNGAGVVEASSLPDSDNQYFATLHYLGDNNYYSLTERVSFIISKVPELVIITPANVTIDDVMTIKVGDASTDGKLNITIGNGEEFTVSVVNGVATVSVEYLPQESNLYAMTLSYYDGSYWNDVKVVRNFHADKITSYEFSISDDTIRFTENATLYITLPGDVNTELIINIDDNPYTVEIINGSGVLANISGLHAGVNKVESTFTSAKYETSSANSTVQVNPNDMTLTVIIPTEQLYVDGSATVSVEANVTINNTVTVYVNGKPQSLKLTDGKANFTIEPLVFGDYVFTAIFDGNENYTYTTAPEVSFNVDKIHPTFNITTSDVVVGHTVMIKVNINSDATGLVIVKINSIEYSLNITAKEYELNVPNLVNGSYPIGAKYYGDNKFYGADNDTAVDVLKMTPTITANETLEVGDKLYIIIQNITSIVGKASGKVEFTIDSTTQIVDVIDGVAVITKLPTLENTYPATIRYSGDSNYYALTQDITLRINKAPDVEITIPESVEIGKDLIITIGDETCDGLLNVSINNGEVFTVPVINGTAVVPESYLPNITGWYKINVNYYNATYWTGGSLETVFHEDLINDYPISIKVTEDGKYATISIEIPSDITRDTGILTINGNETELRITNGIATYTDMFKAGLYNITFAYGGNNKYDSKNNTVMFTKKQSEAFTLNISIDDIFVDETARLNINLPADGDGIVLIDINGSKYYLESVNGSAYLDIKDLTYGTYNVTVRYLGSDLYAPRVNTTSFNVNKIEDYELLVVSSPSFDGKTTLTVYLPEDATGTVSILINNKTFTASVLGKQTTVELNNIVDGVNNYTLTYTGDGKYAVREITGSINSTGTRVNPTVLISAEDIISGEYSLIAVSLPDDATGQVTVCVDGNDYLLTVKNATVSVKVRLTHEGVYNVTAVYSGDGKWNNASNMTTLTVSRISSNIKLNITGDNIIAGVPFTVNVNVDLDATGDITLTVADKKYTAAIKDGLAVFNVTVDASGYYPVSASYDGDDKYTASQTSVVLINAAKNTPEITVNVSDINVGENAVVKITSPSDLTNTLIVKVGDNMYSVVDGTATIPGLGEGTYTVSVIYPGDLKYDSVTVNASFKVSKVTDITPNITSNESGVVINLPEDATGNVTVKINNETYTVPVVNGTAVVPVSVNDTDNITVEYSGDDKYNSTDVNASVTDEGILITPQMTINVNSTINVGETAVLTVKLPADATGTVNVNVSGRIITALVSDGTATVDISGLTSGNNLLEVTYLGDKKYAQNTQYCSVYVLKLNPTVIIKADDINVGENATVIVTVEGATGNVTLNGITKVLADSKATFTLSGYGQGTYTVSAVYNGDDNYNIASNTTTFTVNKVDNIDSSVSANTSTIQLPDDINGDVNVTINNQTYTVKAVNGTVELPVNLSDNDTFSVSYGGDDKYDPITVNGTVNGDNVLITPTMSLSKDKDAYYAGDVAMISVVLPEDATGNVQYRVNGVNYTVLDVKGILMLPVKGSGDYNIEAIYLGDGKYATASKTLSFAAVKINSTLQVMVNDTELHDTVIIMVNVPADATGNVSIIVNEVKYSSVIADGVARFSIGGLAKGHYNVYAVFDGDVKYYKSENTSSFNVISVKTPVDIQIDVVRVGEDAQVKVNLPSYATGNVVLKVDGVSYFQEVGENTNLTFTVPNLDIGKHNITVTYSGDADYSSFVANDVIKVTRASFEYSINATNQTSIYNSGADFRATFYDVYGNLLTNANVKFIVDGKTYDVTTDSNGIGILNAKIPVGNHKVTAVNPDTGYSLTYDLTVKARLSGNKDLVMFYDDGVYGVRVMGDDGNYVGAGVAVKFTIGNKVFTASTNKDGWAYLNVKNIASGKYTIKAEYKGSSVSNMLTVKTLISAKKVSKVKKSAKKTIIQITLKGPKTTNKKNVKFKYNGKTKVTVKFGKDMKGIKVTVKFRGKNFKVKVNKKGMGTLKLTKKIAKKLKKGKKYKAKATWKGFKLYKNKKITIKFNGKKYKVKTNKLSVAKFKVTKKMVKKLKKGKKVKYTIIYGADKQNKFIKIR